MNLKVLLFCIPMLLFFNRTMEATAPTGSDCICGKWELSEKNLIIMVYKEDKAFMAKIVWFDPKTNKPMEEWTDSKNPDETLRNRKILGMDVLEKLRYDAESNSWEDGMIYDAKNGREWNASAYISKEGLLKVKGYWHFKFIGKTLVFKRLT